MKSKFFKVGGCTIEVRSDLPMSATTFSSKFDDFEIFDHVSGSDGDSLVIHHHFEPMETNVQCREKNLIYRHPPWAVYHSADQWIYEWITPEPPHENYYRKVLTDDHHTRLDIYNDKAMERKFKQGDLTSLAMFPSDQIFLGRWLAYHHGCILHSLGVILDSNGYLFVGHSDAGKSTMAGILKPCAKILCDDRNIARQINDKFYLFGTWSHGDVPDVSSDFAELKGIFFLNQSLENRLDLLNDKKEIFTKLLACLIRPLTNRNWWSLSMDTLEVLTREIPCWNLQFTKNGDIAGLIRNLNFKRGRLA